MTKTQLTKEDQELLAKLGAEIPPRTASGRTPQEERIIAGFEDIERFVDEQGHPPRHGEGLDIFERLYALRLDKIRGSTQCRQILTDLDHKGLLDAQPGLTDDELDKLDDKALLAELGVTGESDGDITILKHVRPRAQIKTAEDIAQRVPCRNFVDFKPLFAMVRNDLNEGIRKTTRFRKESGFIKTDFQHGHFLIIGGQTAYIAKVGDTITAPNGEKDARLRVIYDNGTESDILLRSLIRAMYKDQTSRVISEPNAGPLFSDKAEKDDLESGTIYILRSNADDPYIKEHRDIIHKIGVTRGNVDKRFANAKNDPTFLMADVEVIATYTLANINRVKLEKLIHKFFDAAKLRIEIKDRFGKPITPREWFLVPLFVINEAVEKIKNKTIANCRYHPETGQIKMVKDVE